MHLTIEFPDVSHESERRVYNWTVDQEPVDTPSESAVVYRVEWRPDTLPEVEEGEVAELTFSVDGVVETYAGSITNVESSAMTVRTEPIVLGD